VKCLFLYCYLLAPATPSLNQFYQFIYYVSWPEKCYVRVKIFSKEHKFRIFLDLFNNATSTVSIIWRRKRDGTMIMNSNLRTRRRRNTCRLFHDISVAQITQRRMIKWLWKMNWKDMKECGGCWIWGKTPLFPDEQNNVNLRQDIPSLRAPEL
jgi:hypothetical protein